MVGHLFAYHPALGIQENAARTPGGRDARVGALRRAVAAGEGAAVYGHCVVAQLSKKTQLLEILQILLLKVIKVWNKQKDVAQEQKKLVG